RSVFDYNFRVGQSFFTIHSGIELQQGIFNYRTYTNDAGRADSLFEVEDLILRQGMVFAQMDLSFKKWQFNVGGSYSGVQMDMERTKGQLLGDAEKKLNAFAPRIAIGYKPIKSMAV